MWMIQGSSRTLDRLSRLCGLCVHQSKVVETMMRTSGQYNLGGSATHTKQKCSIKQAQDRKNSLRQKRRAYILPRQIGIIKQALDN